MTAAIAREFDVATSHAAAGSVDADTNRGHVLNVFRTCDWFDMTDEELIDLYKWSGQPPQTDSGIRTRRCELVRAGLVEWTGETRPTRAGRASRTWKLSGNDRVRLIEEPDGQIALVVP